MSGASNQAQRAGIRESTGNGNNASSTTSSTHPYIPRLDPNDDEIVKLLQGQKIVKKALKYKIVKNIFQNKAALSAYMEELKAGAESEFINIDFGVVGTTTPAMKAIGQYTSDMLGQLLCNVRNAIRIILPRSQNFNGLTIVRELWVIYDSARLQAATELQSSFSSQFLTITGPERDRRYLDGGYAPTTPGHEICLVCTHEYCDEPDSNRTVTRGQASTSNPNPQALLVTVHHHLSWGTTTRQPSPSAPLSIGMPILLSMVLCWQLWIIYRLVYPQQALT